MGEREECSECLRDLTNCDSRTIDDEIFCEYCYEDKMGIPKED